MNDRSRLGVTEIIGNVQVSFALLAHDVPLSHDASWLVEMRLTEAAEALGSLAVPDPTSPAEPILKLAQAVDRADELADRARIVDFEVIRGLQSAIRSYFFRMPAQAIPPEVRPSVMRWRSEQIIPDIAGRVEAPDAPRKSPSQRDKSLKLHSSRVRAVVDIMSHLCQTTEEGIGIANIQQALRFSGISQSSLSEVIKALHEVGVFVQVPVPQGRRKRGNFFRVASPEITADTLDEATLQQAVRRLMDHQKRAKKMPTELTSKTSRGTSRPLPDSQSLGLANSYGRQVARFVNILQGNAWLTSPELGEAYRPALLEALQREIARDPHNPTDVCRLLSVLINLPPDQAENRQKVIDKIFELQSDHKREYYQERQRKRKSKEAF